MPHFIIDCSEDVLRQKPAGEIMNAVFEMAEASGLFAPNDVKVRLRLFQYYQLGENKQNFIHIFAYIMQGRNTGQKANLSRQIINRLTEMLPEVSFISMNVEDFEKASYCNKALIHPENLHGDRHFALE